MSASDRKRPEDDENDNLTSPGDVRDWRDTDDDFDDESDREYEQQRAREIEEEKRQEAVALKNAKALIRTPDFLARVLDICKGLGVTGEQIALLVLFLAAVSKTLLRPASVMLRGSPSSGKSSVMNAVVELFDPEIVMERAGMSGKALFHGEGSLAGKIIVLTEYHAGKDSRHLIRLAQTEGVLTDETTVMEGRWRSTSITERRGRPVVMTTTSESRIAADDLSRFQIVWADESAEQSLRVMRSRASAPPDPVDAFELQVWRKATSLLVAEKGDFQRPPKWLRALPQMEVIRVLSQPQMSVC